MKLKEGFVLTELGDEFVAVMTGDRSDEFHGVVRLNKSAADIWKGLSEGLTSEQIAEKLITEYEDLDIPHARSSVQKVADKLAEAGLLEEQAK